MIKKIKCLIVGFVSIFLLSLVKYIYYKNKKIKEIRNRCDKADNKVRVYKLWLKHKNNGKNISDYCRKKGWQRIAIYGCTELGDSLVEELKLNGMDVAYGIDRNIGLRIKDLEILDLSEGLEKVDVVIITTLGSFDEIKEALHKKLQCDVVSLEMLLSCL